MTSRLLSVFALSVLAALPSSLKGAEPALNEVNAARAARGLPPFQEDPALTAAACRAADHRAFFRIAGHVPGGMGDFGFLPPGVGADAAGCGALEPSWGWGTCCTYENYQFAGAAVTSGPDGRRYMHIFVRGRQPQQFSERMNYSAGPNGFSYSHSVRSGRRGFFRR